MSSAGQLEIAPAGSAEPRRRCRPSQNEGRRHSQLPQPGHGPSLPAASRYAVPSPECRRATATAGHHVAAPDLADARGSPHNCESCRPARTTRPHDLRPRPCPGRRAAGHAARDPRIGWRRLKAVILPFLWPRESAELRVRVVLACALLVLAKLITVQVPFFFKAVVDGLSAPDGALLALPLAALLAYGLARLSAAGFGELRDAIFAKVARARRAAGLAQGVPATCSTCRCATTSSGAPASSRGSPSAASQAITLPARRHPVQRRPDPARVRPRHRHPARTSTRGTFALVTCLTIVAYAAFTFSPPSGASRSGAR